MSYISYEQAKLNKEEIISDHFESDDGKWNNYSTLDVSQATSLINQGHIDLRSFYPQLTKDNYIVDFGSSKMKDLNGVYMDNLPSPSISSPIIIREEEPWTFSGDGFIEISDTELWRTLRCRYIEQGAEFYSKTDPIDISKYKDANAYILFSIPNTLIDADLSIVYLTADDTVEGFDPDLTDSFELTEYATDDGQNTQIKIPVLNLKNIFNNQGFICGIKFKIYFPFDQLSNEVQRIMLNAVTSGTYTLTFGDQTTAALDFDADASEVQSALEALSNIGSGNVEVVDADPIEDFPPYTFYVTYINDLAHTAQPLIVINDENLIRPSITATVSIDTPGEFGVNGVQTITISGSPNMGVFNITFDGETTGNLYWNASAVTLQAALETLSTIGENNIVVTYDENVYTITFINDLGNINVESLIVDVSNLIIGCDITHWPGGTGNFYCSGIRCIGPDWKYAPLDINTLENRVVKTVPPNGTLSIATLDQKLAPISQITDANWSGGQITFDTLLSHNLLAGDQVEITGVIPAAYNGIYEILTVNDVTPVFQFTVALVSDPGAFSEENSAGLVSPYQIKSNTNGFPDSGRVLINDEYIEYESKTSTEFENLTRGIYGSSIALHSVNSSITLDDFDFPKNSLSPNLPSKWPVLYRSFGLGGVKTDEDPKILSGSVYAVIETGDRLGQFFSNPTEEPSVIATATANDPNVFTFYYRNTDRFISQLELNERTQKQLNALRSISDLAVEDAQRTQGDLSIIPGSQAEEILPVVNESYQENPSLLENSQGLTQYALNGRTRQQLERISIANIAYVSASLEWYIDNETLGESNPKLVFKIKIGDELSPIFEFQSNGELNYWKNKTLVFKSTLNDKTIECKLFELKNGKLILIYSTGKVESNFFHRYKGTFGWTADLKDGQTKIESIRSNRMIYGEYKSVIMNSMTPVKAAQIYSNQTAEKELVTEIKSNKWTVNTKALSYTFDNVSYGKPTTIYTISDSNNGIWQGIETNRFKVENFEDIYIKFDISYSSDNFLYAFLYNEETNALLQLNFPQFDQLMTYAKTVIGQYQWTPIKLTASIDGVLPGYYSFVLAENGLNNNKSWSIKDVSVTQKQINWEARSFVDGPWGKDDRDWVKNNFINLIPNNNFSSGTNKNDSVLFAKQDTELQIRALALNPYVEILNFDVEPKYSTLGNILRNK